MAENDLAENRVEVEAVLHSPTQVHAPTEGEQAASSSDQTLTGDSVNTQEPKDDAAAPQPSATQPNGRTHDSPVATASNQSANPGQPADGVAPAESHVPASDSAPEASTPQATPAPAKRFTSMNINKKFLAKTAGGSSGSSSSPAAPKTTASATTARPTLVNPQPSSRLVTKKLTNIPPAAPASGGWSLRPTPPTSLSSSPAPGDPSVVGQSSSVKPTVTLDTRPSLVTSGSALSIDSRSSAKASRDHSPVKAWATVPSVADSGRNLHDFPTAAEAATGDDGKRPAVSTTQPVHPLSTAVAHDADTEARDSFRGMHLDPNAHHWDEMEDENNDFLGEVIDFGDGKTYTVPAEEGETATSASFNKETRLGDDYDRSWPRSQPLPSESDASSRPPQHHGLSTRQPPGDGRVLFNERSNRLEPARGPNSTLGATSHQNAPPYAHVPRSTVRRNSALSSSDRPKVGLGREPPPHTRDLPPHATMDDRARRPSDARSSHSPVERRSSFLHDDDRSRAGLASLRGRTGDEPGYGLRRETSRDSRLSAGDRPSRGPGLGHRVVSDPWHHASGPGHASPDAGILGSSAPRSPLRRISGLPGVPSEVSPAHKPDAGIAPAASIALSDDREKFMKQAAERARRRKQEEEMAREEARERARKKAAELEALSKASLVTASPLVAMTRRSSGVISPIPKSPIPKSPAATTSALPDANLEPKEATTSNNASATTMSWRAKPNPEPKSAPTDISPQTVPPPENPTQSPRVSAPPTTELGGMHHIDELNKVDGPVEVLDFSDMGKLAGRRGLVTSPPELHGRKRSGASDFLDEVPSSKRPGQGQGNTWHKDRRSSAESHDAGVIPNMHVSGLNKPNNETPWSKPNNFAGSGPSGAPQRSGFKEAPISALDDVMSRIKGVLTDMHAEDKSSVNSGATQPLNGATSTPALNSSSASGPKAVPGLAPRWMGTETNNWRNGSGRKPQTGPPPEPQPTEPFATTCPGRPDTPAPAWKAYTVRLGKTIGVRPPMPKKQVALAKLPPMPVRWDILTWNPPIERMSTRTLSRDDMFFPKTYVRGVLSARVLLPSTGSSPKQNEARPRLTASLEAKPARSPTISNRPPPKGPAFMDNQWRKPQAAASPVTNSLELQDAAVAVPQLETTSRSPPPYHQAPASASSPAVSNLPKAHSKQFQGDVAFHRSLHEKRPSNPPAVSFTVSSELDGPITAEASTEDKTVPASEGNGSTPLVIETKGPEAAQPNKGANDDKSEQKITTGKITRSPTPNSSVLATPPIKVTTPWQGPNSRLPDTDYLKTDWQYPSPKATSTENQIRGLADDFPSSTPHTTQEPKSQDDENKSGQLGNPVSPRVPPHNAHRSFQQVPTSPIPTPMQGYPNHMPNPARPIQVASFSLPPPAPPQATTQPTPYSPYVHPTPPSLMYGMPPNRIAPSPAPGAQMWVPGQPFGRPSPPAVMYPAQQGHAIPYPSPISQLPPTMQKPHVGMNGNHGHHPMTSPAMSHAHAMHMGNPGMVQVTHMGSPAMAHGSPHMPGGPQHMYPGMGSPGGLGLGGMPYGAQRSTPQMMQQSSMQVPVPNGYPMVPSGSYGPAGYGRGAMRSPSDGMPHHMSLPHPQHAPVSPGTYHPTAYGRTW